MYSCIDDGYIPRYTSILSAFSRMSVLFKGGTEDPFCETTLEWRRSFAPLNQCNAFFRIKCLMYQPRRVYLIYTELSINTRKMILNLQEDG